MSEPALIDLTLRVPARTQEYPAWLQRGAARA